MHLFVYYEVPLDREAAVRAVVERMQAGLAGSGRARGRLLRRPVAEGGRATWMEIYEHVDDAFVAALDAAVEHHLGADAIGPRHVERFVEFD